VSGKFLRDDIPVTVRTLFGFENSHDVSATKLSDAYVNGVIHLRIVRGYLRK
jgi:hypothetical protein